MMKPGIFLLVLFLTLGLFDVKVTYSSSSRNDPVEGNIGDELDNYQQQLEGLWKDLDRNTDPDEISKKLERIREDLKVFYQPPNINVIKGDVLLKAAYDKCRDECDKLDEAISKRRMERQTDSLTVKLVRIDSLFQNLKLKGEACVRDGNKETLDSLKEEVAESWGVALAEFNMPENKKIIEGTQDLKKMFTDAEKTKKSIQKMEVKDGGRFFDYLWKIALVLALAFIILNIVISNYKSWKSKKLLTWPEKKDKTPSI
jgi:hypothetical protein